MSIDLLPRERELTDIAYEAVVKPQLWQDFVELFVKIHPSDSCILHENPLDTDGGFIFRDELTKTRLESVGGM